MARREADDGVVRERRRLPRKKVAHHPLEIGNRRSRPLPPIRNRVQRKTAGWHERGPLPSGVLCPSLRKPFRHGSLINWHRFTGVIRHRPLPGSPSHMIKSVPASIRARVGNKLGTVLATSAPCGHNAKTPRWRRASLGFADFKHHRHLFRIPRTKPLDAPPNGMLSCNVR
jgi:hypothetical protein